LQLGREYAACGAAPPQFLYIGFNSVSAQCARAQSPSRGCSFCKGRVEIFVGNSDSRGKQESREMGAASARSCTDDQGVRSRFCPGAVVRSTNKIDYVGLRRRFGRKIVRAKHVAETIAHHRSPGARYGSTLKLLGASPLCQISHIRVYAASM